MKYGLAILMIAAGLPALAQSIPTNVTTLIEQIGLEDAQWHPGEKRADLEGRLAGTWVEIDFHRGGALEEIEADHGGMFPASVIAPIVPAVLKSSPDYPADAQFSKIEFDKDQYEIEGRTAQGQWFEAEFNGAGRLEKWDAK
jgi:hypothetical protein